MESGADHPLSQGRMSSVVTVIVERFSAQLSKRNQWLVRQPAILRRDELEFDVRCVPRPH